MNTKTLLVVDDDLNTRKLLFSIFKTSFHVLSSVNGEESLKLFESNKIDIAILDYHLPGLDGIETLKKIKKGNMKIAVFIMSCDEDYTISNRAKNSGSNGFIMKPFDPEQIKSIIAAV